MRQHYHIRFIHATLAYTLFIIVCSFSLNNIDLFVGGSSETPLRDGNLGPTFTCLLARQFREIRRGDRFYYGFPSGGFTSGELPLHLLPRTVQSTCRYALFQHLSPRTVPSTCRHSPQHLSLRTVPAPFTTHCPQHLPSLTPVPVATHCSSTCRHALFQHLSSHPRHLSSPTAPSLHVVTHELEQIYK